MLLLLVRLLIRGTSQGLNHADLDLHVDDGFRDLGVRDEEEAKFFRFGLGHFFKMRNHVVHIRQREISEYPFEIFACHPTVRRYGKSALLCYRFQSAVVAEADTQSPPIHFDIAQVLDGCKCRVGVVIFHKGVTCLRRRKRGRSGKRESVARNHEAGPEKVVVADSKMYKHGG